jgi:hypothetical protein
MNPFVSHHRDAIRFGYSCFDRLILNGSIHRFQYPGGVIGFLRFQRQLGFLTRQTFGKLSQDYHDWVNDFAAQAGIDIVTPPRDIRREDWVEPYFQRLCGQPGIAVILKAREPERLAVCYTKQQNAIALTRRSVNLYYFYIQNPCGGRMFVRVCPYFPFNVCVWMNGHDWLANQMRQEGIAFRRRDNCFLDCANPQRLQELSDAFGPQDIRALVDPWLARLVPFFTEEERALGYRHQLYLSQVEYCHNLVFHKRPTLDRLFERMMDVNRAIGRPDKLSIVFGRASFHPDTRTGETTVKITQSRTPVLSAHWKSTTAKQYVKEGGALRTETTSYCLPDLAVNKHIDNLGKARAVLAGNNERLLTVEQDILETFVDREHLAHLRQATVSDQGRRTPGLRVDDPRLLALLQALVCFVNLVGKGCFRTAQLLTDVRQALGKADYTLTQLRYDLGKLRGKGLVKRIKGSQSYEMSSEGYRLAVLYLKVYHQVYAPLTSGIMEPVSADVHLSSHRRCRLDKLYTAVDQTLRKLMTHLGIKS